MKSMKTLVAVFVAALALCLTGCKKDNNEDLIIGSWEVTSMEYISVVSGYTGESAEMNGTYHETETPEPGTSMVITFNKDNTLTMSYTEEGRPAGMENGSYSISGDNITLTYNEEGDTYVETYHIDKLDKSSLSLSMNDSYDDTEDGQHGHVDMTVKLNFKNK